MPSVNGLEWTFDTVSDKYAKMRPGYVAEVYQTIFEYKAVDKNSRVLEIGSGGGQATEPMLKTGCCLTAVEYGEQFSNLLKSKFKEYSNFSVVTEKFENAELEGNFDLIFQHLRFTGCRKGKGTKKFFPYLKKAAHLPVLPTIPTGIK